MVLEEQKILKVNFIIGCRGCPTQIFSIVAFYNHHCDIFLTLQTLSAIAYFSNCVHFNTFLAENTLRNNGSMFSERSPQYFRAICPGRLAF